LAIGRGAIKTTGKAKVARISGLAFANLFYGVTPSAGQVATAFGEYHVIPSSATVSAQNASNFAGDNGVVYATTGLPLTKVATNPLVGEYAVAGGAYTFNAEDANNAVLLTYTYTISGAGQNFNIANQLLGTTPTFQAQFYTTFQGQAVSLKLNACTSTKLSFQTKLEDFVTPEFDFSCFADPSGNVMSWSFSEVS